MQGATVSWSVENRRMTFSGAVRFGRADREQRRDPRCRAGVWKRIGAIENTDFVGVLCASEMPEQPASLDQP